MDELRKYILSVVAAAIISGILINLSGQKNTRHTIIKLLAGIYLSIAVLSPLIHLDISGATDLVDFMHADGEVIAQQGRQESEDTMADIIKSQTESYILEKASALNVSLDVCVTLSDSYPAVPCEVSLYGNISPYAKKILQKQIANELGISEEYQTWMQKR